ncbi:MAG: D-2-hydroxyacid dehydrogenase [Gammaproteobacteria bacterium]|nr:D-2-hydroxyacid dehydrogenase [Gammaproteobacteria bacterium]
MKTLTVIVAVTYLLAAPASSAEVTAEKLISQSGLKEGPVAARDLPRWNGASKILIVGRAGEAIEMLQATLPDTELVVAGSESDALAKVVDVEAIVGSCSGPLVEAAEKLVWIQIYWAGAERCLAVPRIASGDVMLTNMQKMSAPVIGEHAVAMALALARGLPVFAKEMQSDTRQELYTPHSAMISLTGKTMLVVGLGGIGTEAARRGAALGMRVIGTRNSSRDGPPFVDYVGLSDELLQLAGKADVIVNALPLTGATHGLLDADFFDATKHGALFVNVGRGATVDTGALVTAIQDGQIAGAGLDVTDPEPLPADHPLWQLDNVIITPHVAGRGGERDRHFTLLNENLRRYAAGERLLNVVDPARGY